MTTGKRTARLRTYYLRYRQELFSYALSITRNRAAVEEAKRTPPARGANPMNKPATKTIPIPLMVLLLLAAPAAGPAAAAGPPDGKAWAAAHEALLDEWRFSADGAALPEGGISFTADAGEWVLESGTVRPMQPLADGPVTGLLFEGQGRFRMAVPDPVERNQLPRFTGSPSANPLEFTFTRMVMRTTNGGLIDRFPAATGTRCEKDRTARDRRQWWQEHARFDVDARIIAGLLNGDGEYLAVDMETAEQGWLFYEFEPWRMEEVRLCRMRKSHDFVEVWVSLDRAEHRRADGRPGSVRTPLVDLEHADLEVDLMQHKGRPGLEISRKTWSLEFPVTRFRARMTFAVRVEGLRAVPLRLNPWSTDVTATDADGDPLPVLRARLGRRFAKILPKEQDISLVVLLDDPLAPGDTVEIDFSWQRQTSNYPGTHAPGPVYTAPYSPYLEGGGQDWYPPFAHRDGRYWYPEPFEGADDRHTARVTLIHPKKLAVQATGRPAEGSRERSRWTSVWEPADTVKTAGFCYGRGFDERRILEPDLPEVLAFGINRPQKIGDTVEAAAALMADSIAFYQETFACRLPLEMVTGTRVNGNTQPMTGFVAYDGHTFDLFSAWDSEWAMARRTAELFWGGLLDWESYRDRWLAEALAGYSAMLYLEAVTGGWGITRRGAISSYDEFIRLRQRRLAYANAELSQQLGPLDVGFRYSTPELFGRSYLRSSSKGIAVLHMLRGILHNQSEDGDVRFKAILADFLKTHAGGTASTRDFIAAAERVTGEDWDWYFDQWVYLTGIPSYSWSHTLAEAPGADGRWRLEIALEQRGVSEGFRMPVPFGLEYGDGDTEVLPLVLDRPSKTFTLDLERRPASVTFDPNHELLYVRE